MRLEASRARLTAWWHGHIVVSGVKEEGLMAFPSEINWLAIGLAGVASALLSYLWYGPIFGPRWKKELERPADREIDKPTIFQLSIDSFASAFGLWLIVGQIELALLLTIAFVWAGLGISFISYSSRMASRSQFQINVESGYAVLNVWLMMTILRVISA
jgi:hypothetical protein